MKKSLLISASLLTLSVVTGIYAQTTTGTSIVDKMKAAAHNFSLSSILNPTDTDLQSTPIKGKKTGDILTAGEYNRILELLSEGGTGDFSEGQILPGWPNLLICKKSDGNHGLVPLAGWDNSKVYYSDKQDRGFWTSFNKVDRKYAGHGLGDLAPYAGECANKDIDNSQYYIQINGGGNGGSGAGWENVPLTDTADFDDSCMYRFQITYTAGGREPHVPKETHYYANGISKTQLVWWLDNDSQLSTFHITASSKNIFRINGAPYGTVGGNPEVSIIKIEKLCGGGGSSITGAPAFYKCTNAQSLDPTNAPCYGAKQNEGSGNERYRPLVAHLSFPSYSPSNLSMFPWHDGTKWKCAISGVGHFDCTDGSVLVADTQASGGGSTSSNWADIGLTGNTPFDINCEYRFKASAPGNTDDDAFIGDDNAYNYIQRVHANRLTYQHIGTSYEHINADTKTTLRQNGNPTNPLQTITQIQKRCN